LEALIDWHDIKIAETESYVQSVIGYHHSCRDKTAKCKGHFKECLDFGNCLDNDVKSCEGRLNNATQPYQQGALDNNYYKTNRNVNGEWKSGYKTGDRWSDKLPNG